MLYPFLGSVCSNIQHFWIYNSDITSCGGMRAMKKWLISARVMFGSAADTLDSHLAEICNYFNNRTTSGVTEGINTRIKLIIRQSYGFKNFDLMKEKLLACLFQELERSGNYLNKQDLSPYMRESRPGKR